jgi:hypothetical protein
MAVTLGIVRAVAKGLSYLLIMGILLFLANLVLSGIGMGRRRGTRPPAR